ncbi:MAG: hypothetical protein KGI08_05190, partial [Thaumarchaeota archaeon]|nr:hypothetical protein [Nitrososphaerota archaeon]
NQVFPQSGRYVEAVSEDGKSPYRLASLLEHYVRKAKLRSQIMPALCKNGDIEGQMTIQVTWQEFKRDIIFRTKKPVAALAPELEDEEDEVEDVEEIEYIESRPVVTVIPDCDLLVLPQTSLNIESALRDGGSVTVICRWSKATINHMISAGEIDRSAGEALLNEMNQDDMSSSRNRDKQKDMVDAAGIKGDARSKYALVYRTWTMLTIDGDRRLYLVYFAGPNRLLSCKRNPYWCDKIDIFSAARDKLDGAFKGRSKLSYGIADLQRHANDVANEGADSSAYALLPIIMTDPEKNPNIGRFILNLAAIWETDPASTQILKFPPLWKDALELIAADKNEIFQALSVNPAQITQIAATKKKLTQAEIANEQQVDILTTADAVIVMEEEILTPMITFMMELDHQYRDKAITVREYGEVGLQMNMVDIPTIQLDTMYQFRWYGIEQIRSAQKLQMMISGLNVIRGIPPQMYPEYRLNLGPLLEYMVENLVGSRLGPLTLVPLRNEIGIDPEEENQLLSQKFDLPVHPQDNFQEHMKVHHQLLIQGDPAGVVRTHMMRHTQMQQAQQQQKMMQQVSALQQASNPPRGSRGPRQGARAQAPRGGQNPAGVISQDILQDPSRMPRTK